MDEMEFVEAETNVNDLICEYDQYLYGSFSEDDDEAECTEEKEVAIWALYCKRRTGGNRITGCGDDLTKNQAGPCDLYGCHPRHAVAHVQQEREWEPEVRIGSSSVLRPGSSK